MIKMDILNLHIPKYTKIQRHGNIIIQKGEMVNLLLKIAVQCVHRFKILWLMSHFETIFLCYGVMDDKSGLQNKKFSYIYC